MASGKHRASVLHLRPPADSGFAVEWRTAFDAQRGKLPVLGDPHRSPDVVAVSRQISELGKLITSATAGQMRDSEMV